MSRLSRLHTSHPDGTVLSKSSQVPAQFETPSQLFPLSLASFNFSLLLQGPPRPQTLTDKTSEQSAVAEENVETKKKKTTPAMPDSALPQPHNSALPGPSSKQEKRAET